jgi:predicted kinase
VAQLVDHGDVVGRPCGELVAVAAHERLVGQRVAEVDERYVDHRTILLDGCEDAPMLGCHVVVTGVAGAGKSTLARALAQALGVVLLSKDRLKEALHEAFPVEETEESLRLSAAAMHVLYDTAAHSTGGTVLDANWRPEADCPRLERLSLPLVQVFCEIAPALAQRRLVERVASGRRHRVHRDALDPDVLRRLVRDAAEPGQALPLRAPVVRVDTSSVVDVTWVAARVSTHAAILTTAAPDAGPAGPLRT